MTEHTTIQGEVSFVHHDKGYITIDYELKGKKKSINGKVDAATQQEWISKKIARKKHQFLIGDTVEFRIELSPRGDKQVAVDIQFRYNTALDSILNKARTDNHFRGYLKIADDQYFVKETASYLFFPLVIAPWQIPPSEQELNEPVDFTLENIEKKSAVTAKLVYARYIKEFAALQKLSKSKTPVTASVTQVTPHAVLLDLLDGKFQSRLAYKDSELKPGDTLEVIITHIGDSRIVVQEVGK